MKDFTTKKARVLAVDVPPTSDFHEIDKDGRLSYDPDKESPIGDWRYRDLPPGNWTILGIASELTEEQCREVVENVGTWGDLFRNYQQEEPYFDTAIESFASLNIPPNSLVLFEKIV